MNETLSTGPETFRQAFEDVVVILSDGNQTLMQKCLKCGFIVRNHAFSKLSHWRSCPLNSLFKYITENEVNGVVQAICLLCNTKLCEPKSGPIVQHYKRCSTKHRLTIEARNAIINAHIAEQSPEVQFIYETAVTQRELDGQRRVNHGISAPGFQVSFVMSPKGLERVGECQVCRKSMKKPSQAYFAYHRKHCTLPSEVLLSVSTQPFDMTISSSIDDAPTPRNAPLSRICFLCNTTESETFLNLYEAQTLHSSTPVFDFVWKFLDDKPSVRDDSIDAANSNWNSICVGCFNKINEYDLACETASRLEEELRWELSQTEATYAAQQQNVAHSSNQIQPAHIEVVEEFQIVSVVDETINLDSPTPAAVEQDQEQEQEQEQQTNGDPIEQDTIELSDDEDDEDDEDDDDDENDNSAHAIVSVVVDNNDENLTIELSDDDV